MNDNPDAELGYLSLFSSGAMDALKEAGKSWLYTKRVFGDEGTAEDKQYISTAFY